MRRLRKKFEGPFKPWDHELLLEELRLIGEYGLKNKRELRRANTLLKKIREVARKAYGLPSEERRAVEHNLISRLYKMGVLDKDSTLDDVLRLEVRDILERRLQTLVYRKGLAKSIYHARQMVVHRHIMVGDRVEDRPSRIVYRDEEDLIRIRPTSPYSDPNHPIWREVKELVEGEE
ncbi:MAG TPA: 30S ribosomal protein S4 [Thermoprotei archaeon]|nr:30S ribosomal protein S4 [Thermoprotei archaeon]